MSRRERISDFGRISRFERSGEAVRSGRRSVAAASPKSPESPKKQTYIDVKRRKASTKPAAPRQNKSTVLRRNGLKKLPPFVPRKVRRHPLRTAAIFGSVAVIVLTIGLLVVRSRTRSKSSEQSPVQAATDVKQNPEDELEKQPTQLEYNQHTVSDDTPRYIRSKKMHLDAMVKVIPVKQQELSEPANIFEAGWYEGSNLPNTGGTALIAGYVASPNKDGVFYSIGSLQVGDDIQVEMGDGLKLNYKVVKTKIYDHDKVDVNELLVSAIPEKEGLNLVTVTKRFDVRTQKYEQRFAVFAVRE